MNRELTDHLDGVRLAFERIETQLNSIKQVVDEARRCKHHEEPECDLNGVGVECSLKDCHSIYAFDKVFG